MNLFATVILALTLLIAAARLQIVLKAGHVPSRFERLRFTRAAPPAGYWAFVAACLAWGAAVLWVPMFIWDH